MAGWYVQCTCTVYECSKQIDPLRKWCQLITKNFAAMISFMFIVCHAKLVLIFIEYLWELSLLIAKCDYSFAMSV